MFNGLIVAGNVKLTRKDFDGLPILKSHSLPNTDMYPSLFQFKFQGIDKNWYMVDIIHVKNEDETETGVNFLTTKIKVK